MAKGKHDRQEYAVKFFLTRHGFDVEEEMYRSGSGTQGSPLSQFLPKVCRIASSPSLLRIFAALSETMPRVHVTCDICHG
jgi:hypothetical protein